MSARPEQLPPTGLAAQTGAGARIALDTEFMGEGRYRTLLCLVQLAIPERDGLAERIELLDPLDQELDCGPLSEAMSDPQVQVVVHAGRQDIALVRRRFGTEVRNVFDTQLAAAFAGLGAQVSYESLLDAILGVRVGKSASFTRWDRRPLSAEQLAYAREDVVHLLALAQELERRLAELGRLQWAREECEQLERSSDEREPGAIFERLPRVRSLSATARPLARALVSWREGTAARADRPAQSILPDAALVEIARRRPTTRGELTRVRGAAEGHLRRHADQLLEVLARASALPPEPPPAGARPPLSSPEHAPLIALAETLLRARAREAGLAYELLAARADLQEIVACWHEGGEEADVRTLRGWRRELVGAELLALLDGRISVSVSAGAVRIARHPGES